MDWFTAIGYTFGKAALRAYVDRKAKEATLRLVQLLLYSEAADRRGVLESAVECVS